MDNYTDYNDNKKVTYHEQTDISNILKLRAVLKTLPDFCKDYPMHMISVFFFSFYWMKILLLKTVQ